MIQEMFKVLDSDLLNQLDVSDEYDRFYKFIVTDEPGDNNLSFQSYLVTVDSNFSCVIFINSFIDPCRQRTNVCMPLKLNITK